MNFVQFGHNSITPIMFGSGTGKVPILYSCICLRNRSNNWRRVSWKRRPWPSPEGILALYLCHLQTVLTTFLMFSATENSHVHKREGRNPGINLELYQEALKYPKTRLTMSVLRGDRKQSVRDAELTFNPNFLKWLGSKGYTAESEYMEAVLGWHRANNKRGLSEEERSSLNERFLWYILDDLMPWNHSHDFSQLKVNLYYHLQLSFIYWRTINNIRGFTRETTTALLTTIESTEWMRKQATKGLVPVEHPRALTTDDVECFFSMRDLLGSSFRLTTVMQEWRKICVWVWWTSRSPASILLLHFWSWPLLWGRTPLI